MNLYLFVFFLILLFQQWAITCDFGNSKSFYLSLIFKNFLENKSIIQNSSMTINFPKTAVL